MYEEWEDDQYEIASALTAARPRKKGDVIVPPVPCSRCGTSTRPSWRGMCRSCYDHTRRGGY